VNDKQKKVLLGAIILIALMGLVPPWQQRVVLPLVSVNQAASIRYAPIFLPPAPDFSVFPEQYQKEAGLQKMLQSKMHITLDLSRLGVEWGTVLLVAIGLLLLLMDKKARTLAPKERMSFMERMKRAGAAEEAVPEMAFDEQDMTEADGENAPKHVFSDEEL
jgi:uncharacterized protein YbcC (UPF0753/DUF2309 family)